MVLKRHDYILFIMTKWVQKTKYMNTHTYAYQHARAHKIAECLLAAAVSCQTDAIGSTPSLVKILLYRSNHRQG